MQNDNTITFDDEEIIIRLKPEILEGHGWTGDLSINFEVFDNNPLNNEQYLAVFKLAKMMASLPLFMEKDNQLMERVGVLYDQIEPEDQISGVDRRSACSLDNRKISGISKLLDWFNTK